MKRFIGILLLTVMLLSFAGCGKDKDPVEGIGGTEGTNSATQKPTQATTQAPTQAPTQTLEPVELTEEQMAILQKNGVSLEAFSTYAPEKQHAILAELGITPGQGGGASQETEPPVKEYTAADVAAGGKYVVYIGDSMMWNYYELHYEDGKLVKAVTSFRKSSEEDPDVATFEGDNLKDFQYIDKALDELIRFFDEKNYGYHTRINSVA